jgi:hypothetical protein
MLTSFRYAAFQQRQIQASDEERRFHDRYSIELEMTYTLVLDDREVGRDIGKTTNLSSAGLFIESTSPVSVPSAPDLARRCHVKVHVNWPVAQDGLPLEFIAEGTLRRCEPPYFAVEVCRHHLRPRLG